MTATPAPNKRPMTEALLSIDALPVWGGRTGLPREPASRVGPEPAGSGASATRRLLPCPAVIAPARKSEPKRPLPPPAAAGGLSALGGGRSIGLGIAAGIVAILPFLDRSNLQQVATTTAAQRYPQAALPSASLVAAASAAVIAPVAAATIRVADDTSASLLAIPSARTPETGDASAAGPAPPPEGRPLAPTGLASIVPPLTMPSPPTPAEIVAVASREEVAGHAPLPIEDARSRGGERVRTASSLDRSRSAPNARIVIHFSGSAGRPNAEATARRLGRQGMKDVALRQVAFAIRNREVRIFSAQDAAQASRVASAASPGGSPLRISDFRHYRPSPSAGLVEVWVR